MEAVLMLSKLQMDVLNTEHVVLSNLYKMVDIK